MRNLVMERDHTTRLHAIDCPTVHPASGKRVNPDSLAEVINAARAGCCAPTLDEWRNAVHAAATIL